MKEELKLIADFDMNMIEDFFSPLDRQGPGSEEVTKLALSFVGNLSPESKIADIGCGAGGQTSRRIREGKSRLLIYYPR